MASCRLPVVLGIALISIGHILAFKSVNFESFPGAMVRKQKPNESRMENKMKELQEQFGAASKSENKTKEEVGAVKSKVEELTKTVEGSKQAVAETMKQMQKISDRMANFEVGMATAEKLKDSVDEVFQSSKTHKIDIAELKASKVNMNARITNLGSSLDNVNKEVADTKKEVRDGLKKAQQFIQHTATQLAQLGTKGAQSGTMHMGGGTSTNEAVVEAAQGTTSMTGDECPSPFQFIEETGQCLKVSDPNDKASSMATGSSKCTKFNKQGSLAILDTKEKQDGAKKYLYNQGVRQDILVGGFIENGKYKWMNDEDIGMVGWCPGQPDAGRRCVSLWQGMGFCLDDSHCDQKMYLCEMVHEDQYDYEEG